MPFSQIAAPQHLMVLTKILDEFCQKHDVHDGDERSNVGRCLMSLFSESRCNPDELMLSLEKSFLARRASAD